MRQYRCSRGRRPLECYPRYPRGCYIGGRPGKSISSLFYEHILHIYSVLQGWPDFFDCGPNLKTIFHCGPHNLK